MTPNVALSADNKRFIAAFEEAAGAIGKFTATMNVNLANSFKQADYFTNRFEQGFGRLGNQFKNVGTALTASITAPLAAASGMAYKTFSDIDALERSLSQYGVTLKEVKELAKLPGLGLEEAASSLTSLLSVRFNADLARRAMIGFGNALTQTGKGKAELDGINTALAQMKGKGKVSAEEINQIAERLPMIRDLMQKAFGTADTEALQKMGLSADKFLEKITAQLEKLPKATAGPKAILENFGDSVKIMGYEVGKALERNFNISDKFLKVGDVLDNLADKFSKLSPFLQKATLLLGGAAAAIGPLSFGIGTLIRLTPTIASGFASMTGGISAAFTALTGPIGIAVAAVASLGYIVYKNWDSIKAVLRDTGVLESMKNAMKALRDVATQVWNKVSEVATAAWNRIKVVVLPIVKFVSEVIVNNLRAALTSISGLLDFFTGLFEGDVTKMGNGLTKAFGGIWNRLIDLAAGGMKILGRVIQAGLSYLGLDDTIIGKANMGALNNIDQWAERWKIKIDQVKTNVGDVKQVIENVPTPKPEPDPTNNPAGKKKDVKGLGYIGMLDVTFEGLKDPVEETKKKLRPMLDYFNRISDETKKRMQEATKQIGLNIKVPTIQLDPADAMRELKVDEIAQKFDGPFQRLAQRISSGFSNAFESIQPALKASWARFKDVVGGIIDANFLGNAFGTIFESIGTNLNEKNGVKKILKDVSALIGDTLIMIGKQMLIAAVALLNPLTAPVTGAFAPQFLGGAGLVVAGAALKATKFKDGGVTRKPRFALFGEYAGAYTNPEITGRFDQFKTMLQPMFSQALNVGRSLAGSNMPAAPSSRPINLTVAQDSRGQWYAMNEEGKRINVIKG